MVNNSYLNYMRKIDSHVHFGPAIPPQSTEQLYRKMLDDMDGNGVDKFAIMVVEYRSEDSGSSCLSDVMWFKSKQPERVYVFGGLSFDRLHSSKPDISSKQLVTELEELFRLECNGLKLLFGKPDVRKALGVPLDDPVFTPLFNKLEETGFPIVWHIADPAEFWDSNPAPVPQWAHGRNWTYDNSHPSYQQIKAEAENVFNRHPALNLTLPHFYFMSDDLVAAAEFLERHPNINIDLAPGVEMCHNCSTKLGEARDFFIKYDKRILFGSDSGMGGHITSLKRSQMVQDWLEKDGEISVPVDDPCMMPDIKDCFQGLALPEKSLHRIYSENFMRIIER